MWSRRVSAIVASAVLLICSISEIEAKTFESVEVFARNTHMLNALNIYDNLITSTDCITAGGTLGFNTDPLDDNWWSWAYNYPQYGLGFSYTSMGELACRPGGKLGDVFTLFGYFKSNLLSHSVFSLSPKLEFGASYLTKTWHPRTNALNTYVGTPILVMVGMGLEIGWNMTPNVEIGATAMLVHRSNGMLKTPNHGLNELSTGAFLKYSFSEKYLGKRGVKPTPPDFKRLIFDVYFTSGVHSCDAERHVYDKLCKLNGQENRWNEQRPWKRLNVGGTVSWRYHPAFASGVGLDVSYTENWKRLSEYYDVQYGTPVKTCPIYVGAYLQQSFYYENVEIGIGLGAYLFKRTGIEDSSWNYQRAYIRYHFSKWDKLWAGFGFRAHSFDRSDMLEFTIGHRF